MRKTLHAPLMLLIFVPASVVPALLAAQSGVNVPTSQCIWRAGDDPAWAAPNFDETGWQAYSQWKPADHQQNLWVRCHADLSPIQGVAEPAIHIGLDSSYHFYLVCEIIIGAGNRRSVNSRINAIRTSL